MEPPEHDASFRRAFDARRFFDRMRTIGHGAAVGLDWEGEGEGETDGAPWVALRLPWRDELIGDPEARVMASGPIFTLMDNATSLATWRTLGVFRPQATLDFRIDYLRPARSGRDVIGRGECYHVTRSIAFVRGTAWDDADSDPVAHVAGTFMFTGAAWDG